MNSIVKKLVNKFKDELYILCEDEELPKGSVKVKIINNELKVYIDKNLVSNELVEEIEKKTREFEEELHRTVG